MKRPRTKRTSRWLLAVCIIAGALFVAGSNRTRNLEADGRRIAHEIPGPGFGRYDRERWFWASPGALLRIVERKIKSNAFPGAMVSYAPATAGEYETHGPRNRHNQDIERLCRADGRFSWMYIDSVSPDGKWSLWSSVSHHAPYKWVAASMDGRRILEWTVEKSDYWSPVLWLPDSSGWVRFRNAGPRLTDAEIHRLDDPSHVEVRPLANSSGGGMPLGWTSNGRAVVGTWGQFVSERPGVHKAYFALIDLNRPMAEPTRFAVDSPGGPATVEWVALSQRADKIAWILCRAPASGWFWRFAQAIRLHDAPYGAVELWTSSLTGKNSRLIASTRATAGDDWSCGQLCSWSPDGKSIHYHLHESVRVIDL